MSEDYNTYILNIERVVISAILFDASKIEEIADLLETKDLLHPSHRHIYDVCLELHSQKIPITIDFVRERLKDNRLVSSDEFMFIVSTSPIDNIEAYITEIKNASIKRELLGLANMLREKSFDTTLQSDEILDEIEKRVFEISSQGAITAFQSSQKIVDDTLAHINELKRRGNKILVGLNTGFEELNRKTTGFNNGELIVIGARPGTGKTSIMLNMIQPTLNQGLGVAIFSLEMSATSLMLRSLSALTSIPLQDLRIGNLDDRQWEILSQTTSVMRQKLLFVDDASMLSIAQLRSKLRKLKSQEPKLSLAAVDYLQLMNTSFQHSNIARHQIVGEFSRGLKTLARELGIPIIALSQLSRAPSQRNDKRPILSDLRESGSIEQDADVVILLYRAEEELKQEQHAKIAKLKADGKTQDAQNLENQMRKEESQSASNTEKVELIIAKNRNGATGIIKIQFNKPYTRFEDTPREQESSYEPTPTKLDTSDSPIQTVRI